MITEDAQGTEAFGRKWACTLLPAAIVALHGDLGSGKTTFVKGIVSALTGIAARHVCSPTFTRLHCYKGAVPIYHFDLYRLKSMDEFIQSGFTDYFGNQGICLIEWPDRITSLLPQKTTHVCLSYHGQGKRKIDV